MSEEAAQEGAAQPSTQPEQGQDQQTAPDTNGQSSEQVDVQALRDEVERWKAASRKTERDAKNTQKEIERLQRASMSEQERAVAQARDEARAEAVREMGGRLVAAELRGALKGRLSDGQAAALLESVDTARFLTDEGEPDTKSIGKWADAVAPPKAERGFPDLGQGVRDSGSKTTDMNALIRAAKYGQS